MPRRYQPEFRRKSGWAWFLSCPRCSGRRRHVEIWHAAYFPRVVVNSDVDLATPSSSWPAPRRAVDSGSQSSDIMSARSTSLRSSPCVTQ